MAIRIIEIAPESFRPRTFTIRIIVDDSFTLFTGCGEVQVIQRGAQHDGRFDAQIMFTWNGIKMQLSTQDYVINL